MCVVAAADQVFLINSPLPTLGTPAPSPKSPVGTGRRACWRTSPLAATGTSTSSGARSRWCSTWTRSCRHPPKLGDMVRRAVGFDENLAPVRVVSWLISIRNPMRTRPSRPTSCPRRGAGDRTAGVDVSYLDAGPDVRDDWAVTGCERSQQICEHDYGDVPAIIDPCPDTVVGAAGISGPAPDQVSPPRTWHPRDRHGSEVCPAGHPLDRHPLAAIRDRDLAHAELETVLRRLRIVPRADACAPPTDLTVLAWTRTGRIARPGVRRTGLERLQRAGPQCGRSTDCSTSGSSPTSRDHREPAGRGLHASGIGTVWVRPPERGALPGGGLPATEPESQRAFGRSR